MKSANRKVNILTYRGSNWLRQRLLLSTLSSRTIRVKDIRSFDDDVGLREFEISLIRLFDKVTNGTLVEINETGTSLFYQPGLLQGGKFIHDCCVDRGIGYYLEVLLAVGPFCKHPLEVTLRGVTNNNIDPSVDHFKVSALPLLKHYMLDVENLNIEIKNRGVPPLGGGEIRFTCPITRQLRPVQLLRFGKVKKIQGTAYALRMSTDVANRVVSKSKGTLLKFTPDIFITTDHNRGKLAGKCPGFGVHLVAETTEGVFYSSEKVSNDVTKGEDHSVPEDLGEVAANQLLDEIYRGGCVDSSFQALAILFMVLGPPDVSKIIIGTMTDNTVAMLRHLRDFFGVICNLEHYRPEVDSEIVPGDKKILITCLGVGFVNLNRRVL